MNRFGILSKPLAWLMAVLLTVFAAGCGGGGDSGSSTAATTAATTPAAGPIIPGASCTAAGALIPRVTASSPISGDLTVTTSTSGLVADGGKLITASFSLAMDPATINSNPAGTLSTFTIKNNTTAGSTVIGTVAMNVSATTRK